MCACNISAEQVERGGTLGFVCQSMLSNQAPGQSERSCLKTKMVITLRNDTWGWPLPQTQQESFVWPYSWGDMNSSLQIGSWWQIKVRITPKSNLRTGVFSWGYLWEQKMTQRQLQSWSPIQHGWQLMKYGKLEHIMQFSDSLAGWRVFFVGSSVGLSFCHTTQSLLLLGS